MSSQIITHVNIVLPDRILEDHSLEIADGRIVRIFSGTSGGPALDGKGHYLCPGFIDLHIHAVCNHRLDSGPEALEHICGILPRYGITGFLPTFCPRPEGEDADFIGVCAAVQSRGSTIMGFHLEGPFVTLPGAMLPEALGHADIQRVRSLIDAARPHKAIFSIAPDFESIETLLPIMARDATPVFITHTQATAPQTQRAIELGACHATHFYDVFYPPAEVDCGVRPCGAVEAILASDKTTVDFILDGEHVDPVAVRMALQCLGPDRVCLITDANSGAGLPPGVYGRGDQQIQHAYAGAPARRVRDGVLSGSGLTMDRAVKNAVTMLGLDLPSAVKLASTNPARVLKLENTGHIDTGMQADLVLMDADCRVLQTWVNGHCCFEA